MRARARRLIYLALTVYVLVLALAGQALAQLGDAAPQVVTNAQHWNLLIGAVLPALIAVLKQSKWPMPLQSFFALAACAAAALGTAYWQSTLSWENWSASALTIAIAAWTSYLGFWKPTKIADKITAATDLNLGKEPTKRGHGRKKKS